MKKILLSVAAISTLAFSGGDILPMVVIDDELDFQGVYMGAAISSMSTRESRVSMDITEITDGQDRLGNIYVLAGYTINDYLAVEGRYAFNITDTDLVTLSSQWSLFLKPMYKFENEEDRSNGENYFAIYGLLGYGGTDIEAGNISPTGIVTKVDDTGFQWGIGLSYTFREASYEENYKYKDSWTVFIDYVDVGKLIRWYLLLR